METPSSLCRRMVVVVVLPSSPSPSSSLSLPLSPPPHRLHPCPCHPTPHHCRHHCTCPCRIALSVFVLIMLSSPSLSLSYCCWWDCSSGGQGGGGSGGDGGGAWSRWRRLSRPRDSAEPCTNLEAPLQSSSPFVIPPPHYSLLCSTKRCTFLFLVTMFPFVSGYYFLPSWYVYPLPLFLL